MQRAQSGTRTHTPSRAKDFESSASAIPPSGLRLYATSNRKVVDVHLDVYQRTNSLASPLQASHQRHASRTHLYVRFFHDGTTGWGEVSPQPSALNGDASFDEVRSELLHQLIPLVHSVIRNEGNVPHWSRIARFTNAFAASRMATTLVEMALLDWWLRRDEESIVTLWPPVFDTPALQTMSALEGRPLLDDSPSHIRLKVDARPLSDHMVKSLALAGDVLLDYNCCSPSRDEIAHHLAQLAFVTRVRAIEQPFEAGNVVDHALLRAAIDAPVSIDEGVRNRRDIDQIVQYGAADIVCIKPARVGGYSVARTMFDYATGKGLRPYLGGFFESPLARGANRALAQHLVREPSDVAPPTLLNPGQWVSDDLGFGLTPGDELLSTFEPLLHVDFAVGSH